ncbi:MAG: prephenate/arogenate dehydrogenase family protein [Rhizobiales bacterium]|nr:prephenate/arogenate dehydrogenase family protein [Hyphomicrobiales bacterium]MBL6770079.1 prephenate/arogenate dehydrogenase family protein [Hyphomicrobiales bacterium]
MNNAEKNLFGTVAIIGIGLIGSSIARGIKKYNIANKVVGYAKTLKTRKKAMDLGYMDQVFDSASDAIQNANLVILCIPVGANRDIMIEISDNLSEGTILTDVGSVKAEVIKQLHDIVPDTVSFVPAHPIAGTEFSGPESGFAELFDNKWCVLTPYEKSRKQDIEKVKNFWERLGMNVDEMSPEYHDLVLAITSHIPHLIAYNIVGTATNLTEITRKEVTKYAAGGFRDFTRIASSDPIMWRDIFLNNQEAVLEMLDKFSDDLSSLREAIKKKDGQELQKYFTKTRDIRRKILQQESK